MMKTTSALAVQYTSMTTAMAVAQTVEQYSGHPITFWISAFLGAVLLRPLVEGPESDRLNWPAIATGVFLAWAGTDFMIEYLSIDPTTAKPLVAAGVAGIGEYLIKVVFGGDLFRKALTGIVDIIVKRSGQ